MQQLVTFLRWRADQLQQCVSATSEEIKATLDSLPLDDQDFWCQGRLTLRKQLNMIPKLCPELLAKPSRRYLEQLIANEANDDDVRRAASTEFNADEAAAPVVDEPDEEAAIDEAAAPATRWGGGLLTATRRELRMKRGKLAGEL